MIGVKCRMLPGGLQSEYSYHFLESGHCLEFRAFIKKINIGNGLKVDITH